MFRRLFRTINDMKLVTTFFLAACLLAKGGVLDAPPITAANQFAVTSQFLVEPWNITSFGDSFTQGAGLTNGNNSWWNGFVTLSTTNFLSTYLYNRQQYQGGIGGQSSAQIAVRMGAIPTFCYPTNGSIPSTTNQVILTFATGLEPLNANSATLFITGAVCGVTGYIKYVTNSSVLFTYTNIASPITVSTPTNFVIAPDLSKGLVTIEAGYNDITRNWRGITNISYFGTASPMMTNPIPATTNVISSMVASVVGQLNNNYVVFTILNAYTNTQSVGTTNYQSITNINAWIVSNYGYHAYDWRTILNAQWVTFGDTNALANDWPPLALVNTSSIPHLNDTGNLFFGTNFYQWIMTNMVAGWPSEAKVYTFHGVSYVTTNASLTTRITGQSIMSNGYSVYVNTKLAPQTSGIRFVRSDGGLSGSFGATFSGVSLVFGGAGLSPLNDLSGALGIPNSNEGSGSLQRIQSIACGGPIASWNTNSSVVYLTNSVTSGAYWPYLKNGTLRWSLNSSGTVSDIPSAYVSQGTTNAVTLTSFTATFSTPFTDTNYTAIAIGNGFALAGSYVSNKTTTNCVFNMTVATGLIDWIAVRQ